MTKNAGMEQYYEKMGGTCSPHTSTPMSDSESRREKEDRELIIAMAPDEAAPILADFAGKLNMEMSGKFWAPSTSSPSSLPSFLLILGDGASLHSSRILLAIEIVYSVWTLMIDGARGIGNAKGVMGKEWASQPGPLELPW
jgi:hypothetical protein